MPSATSRPGRSRPACDAQLPSRPPGGRAGNPRQAGKDGVYLSQFVTGTGHGGLTAHPGGDRWRWKSRIFARAPTTRRPRDKVEQSVTAWVAGARAAAGR
ncbi:DUF3626 domain-containing protein [Microtetraspora fusca]|uniref:DUF3626 domain-containing protein n=1 Tax=Microtetraspora fusca TaxID=1997 RepID=A0ABW6V0V8_MICFU